MSLARCSVCSLTALALVLLGCVSRRPAAPAGLAPEKVSVAAPLDPLAAPAPQYALSKPVAVVLPIADDIPDPVIHLGDAKTAYALAISGGGANGAYGAGLLNGWTASGQRPQFNIVTGISTGALLATFAFLGPKYDAVLTKSYTEIDNADIFDLRSLLTILGQDSLASTAPLAKMIAGVITPPVLVEVAQAYKEGRRLYIGTTNLDTGRLVVWDMGAIAASGQPGALELYRSILLASSSIPIVFPPVFITAYADGKVYSEMHADGGCRSQVFFRGFVNHIRRAVRAGGTQAGSVTMNLYVIRNGKLTMDWQDVPPRLGPIAGRSADVILNASAKNDLARIAQFAAEYHCPLYVAAVPDDYKPGPSKGMFDPVEMRRLYKLAYDQAAAGDSWQVKPSYWQQDDLGSAPATQPAPK